MDAGHPPRSGDARLPAARPPGAVARPGVPRPRPPGAEPAPPRTEPGPPRTEPGPPRTEPGPPGPHRRRRLTRTRRGAVGSAILAAAVLLWPFAGWFWVPWLAGLLVLALVAVLRLDRLLRGWSWHVGGLAVLAGLMLRTGPWDWALAASLGVLLAGLVQLPWWRLAAVGAVLCVASGVGWGTARYHDAQQAAAQQAQASLQSRGQLGVARPTLALQVLLSAVGRGDASPVCDSLLAEPARASFAAAAGAPDCAAAVHSLAARVDDPALYGRGRAPSAPAVDVLTVDACHVTWPTGTVPGPQIGVFTVGRVDPGTTFVVMSFRPCPA